MTTAETGILSQAPPHPRRFVTSHDESGNAIFSIEGDIPHTSYYKSEQESAVFHVPWTSEGGLPVSMPLDEEDRAVKKAGGSLAKQNGIVCRYVDFPPNSISPMHRTHSLDYGMCSLRLDPSCLSFLLTHLGPRQQVSSSLATSSLFWTTTKPGK